MARTELRSVFIKLAEWRIVCGPPCYLARKVGLRVAVNGRPLKRTDLLLVSSLLF